MKNISFVCLSIWIFYFLTPPLATYACDGTTAHPCIVADNTVDQAKIKKWRTALMMAEAYTGNTHGLKHLWVSASSAPTKEAFKLIQKNIHAQSGAIKIIDLDLRQESHAYLNGLPITLLTLQNWINKGKTHAEALLDEKNWVETLNNNAYVTNVLSKKQFTAGDFNAGIEIKIIQLQLEQDVVEPLGFEYQRLTVTDHLRPLDSEVDNFIQLVRGLSPNVWIHLHCRGGKGRSTTFFAMLDMLKNADRVSFQDIIKRQASVSPYYDLAAVEQTDPNMTKFFKERYQFLMHFYQYATDYINHYPGSWSEWRKTHQLALIDLS